jgi:hypothetical protein
MLHIAALLAGAMALYAVFMVMGKVDKVQPELLDTSQTKRTQENEYSSYAQTTNHMPRTSFVESAQGMPTPFRVNGYTAVR